MRWSTVTFVVVALAAAGPAKAVLRPFASVSGACEGQSTSFTLPKVATAHSRYLVRFRTSAGPSVFNSGDPSDPGIAVGGDDTAWHVVDALYAQTVASVTCAAPLSYTVDFFDPPAAPTVFAGATTYAAPAGPSQGLVEFRVAHAARYVADVILSGGAVSLTFQGRTRVFASSGRFALGSLRLGHGAIALAPQPGAQARWTLSIRPLPVRLAGAGLDRRYLRRGKRLTVRYSVDGDTRLSARVESSSGRVIRRLARSGPVGAGAHALRWDGRDRAARRVKDGVYAVVLTSVDFAGHPDRRRLAITVDAHGPIARVLRLPRWRHGRLVLVLRDRVSGLSSAALFVDRRRVAHLVPGRVRLTYLGDREWSPGRHRIVVRMLDRAGNTSRLRRSFTVPDPLRAAVAYARSRSGRVAFAIIDESGVLRGYHLDEGFRSASVVKAMLLVSYLRDVVSSGPLAGPDAETLREMIELSDNRAAETIYRRVGDVGLGRLAALSRMRNFTTLGYWGDNNITAADQARLFELLPRLVPFRHRRFAEGLLAGVVSWQRWGIPAAAPGWRVYFKGGWKPTPGGFSTHQSAYLERGGRERFVLVVLTEGPDQAYGEQTIAEITRRLLAARAY